MKRSGNSTIWTESVAEVFLTNTLIASNDESEVSHISHAVLCGIKGSLDEIQDNDVLSQKFTRALIGRMEERGFFEKLKVAR